MSKYLDDKLYAMCFKFICDKYNTADLNDEQIKEIAQLKKCYISKASEFLKENGSKLFEGIPTQKVFENALYHSAIEILAQDISAKLI